MYRLAGTAALLLPCLFFDAIAMAETEPSPSPSPSTLLVDLRKPIPLSATEERALDSLEMFKECPVCPDMIVIPAGQFMMGSPDDEDSSEENERPRHRVTFANRFAVGRFSISFDEWDACVADRGCRGYRPADRGWGRGRQPVINVWWEDAKAYVSWLSNKTQRRYRLLTEAEREYVTRAGTATPFWWGASLSTDRANYDGLYTYPMLKGVKGEARRKTLPVDFFSPNPWGLHHVHGNVHEWVEDCWHPNYREAPQDGSARIAADCDRHVLRGGSWTSAGWQLRSASRGGLASAVTYLPSIGFRVARSMTKK